MRAGLRLRVPDAREMTGLGARVGARLRPGDLVCLMGPLGSGKTTLVRGILRGLGFRGRVASPTFAIANEYRGLRPRVHHLDLYRLSREDIPGIGLEEYLEDAGAACLIEWPEAAAESLPDDRLEAVLSYSPSGRLVRLRASGPRSRVVLEGLR